MTDDEIKEGEEFIRRFFKCCAHDATEILERMTKAYATIRELKRQVEESGILYDMLLKDFRDMIERKTRAYDTIGLLRRQVEALKMRRLTPDEQQSFHRALRTSMKVEEGPES